MTNEIMIYDGQIVEDSQIVERESDVNERVEQWESVHKKSVRTADTYHDTMADFRAYLAREKSADLFSDPAVIALAAEEWAAKTTPKTLKDGTVWQRKQVAPSTYRLRLAIISSFYVWNAKKAALKGLPDFNPIRGAEHGKMGKVTAYAGAKPIIQAVKRGLKSIDRTTLQGRRDYALLKLFTVTGRRLSEIVSMTLGDLTFGEKFYVRFPHVKGGDPMNDELSPEMSAALAEWLAAFYQTNDLPNIPKDKPVWVSLSRRNYGAPMGIQTVGDLCLKYFGTSKVHALRHTFAVMMEKAGASLSEIQRKLGHKNPATTGIYLAQLTSAENAYAPKLEEQLSGSD